jgi:hypothetical protein
MSIETIETYQDFELTSDEKPSIGSVIFVDQKKYIVTRAFDRRVWHNVGHENKPGFNPDLAGEPGWMRYRIVAERNIE